MSEELDNLLENTTGILMAIDELHTKLPEMENISKKIDDELKTLKSLGKEQVEELNKTKEDGVLDISEQIEKAKLLLDKINKALNETNELHKETKKIIKEAQTIANNIKNGKNKDVGKVVLEKIDIDLILDYVQPHTIKYLYEKYKDTDIPVIVRKIIGSERSPKIWSENYCFYVKGVENDKALGNYYEYAKLKPIADLKYLPNSICPVFALNCNKKEVQKIIDSEK